MNGSSNSSGGSSRLARWRLRIASDSRQGLEILTLSGRISHESAPQLAAALSRAAEGHRPVVIDVAAVDYVSSAGLAVLGGAANGGGGNPVVLANVSEALRISLDLADLLSRLAIEPSLDRAVERACGYR